MDMDQKSGIVKLAHATYSTPDRDKDRTFKGVFNKSWKEFKDTRFFFNHDKLQTPGTVKEFGEDDTHGYTIVQMGDWTLGQDVLKMMLGGAVSDVSYSAEMTKWRMNELGGKDYHEGLHKETSVLTHWGSHPNSKVMTIKHLSEDVLKSLNDTELSFLRDIIATSNGMLANLVLFAAQLPETSDLYIWANDMIADQSRNLGYLKSRVVYGQKEWTNTNEIAALKNQLSNMRAFCSNSTATDGCLTMVAKQADELENFLNMITNTSDTTAAQKALQQSASGENSDDFQRELYLLKLKMSLT